MEAMKGVENGGCKESPRIKRPYLMVFVFSMLISIGGGSLLGWWLHEYHPTNRQLWMVPFGLIFFLTPLIVWFSLFVSDLCISKSEEEEGDFNKMNQRIHPVNHDSLCGL